MRVMVLMLSGLLVIQAMKHSADMQLLEEKIKWLESIEPQKCICEAKMCPEPVACPEITPCPECPSYSEICE